MRKSIEFQFMRHTELKFVIKDRVQCWRCAGYNIQVFRNEKLTVREANCRAAMGDNTKTSQDLIIQRRLESGYGGYMVTFTMNWFCRRE